MAGETIGMAFIEGIQGMPATMEEFLTLCIENGKAYFTPNFTNSITPHILKIFLTITVAICIRFTIEIILNKIYRWWRRP